MRAVRLGALAAALLVLAACSRDEATSRTTPLPALETITVKADGGVAAKGKRGRKQARRSQEQLSLLGSLEAEKGKSDG